MTTNNPNVSLNQLPLLSEEMQRSLQLWAWKDENFREALIADPKGIIQQVFHQSLPNGKLPDDLTIKVVEEDPFTHYMVVPSHSDEAVSLEIPEEDQLDLIVNLGELGKRSRDSYDARMGAQSTGERKPSFTEMQYKQKEQKEQNKYTSEPHSQNAAFGSKELPAGKKIEQLYDRDNLRHVVLRPLRDQLQAPKEELDLINKAGDHLGCELGTYKQSEMCGTQCPSVDLCID